MSIFSHIGAKRPQKSAFNMTHTRKFSFDPGFCMPTLCQEVLPSDKWNYAMSALVRFQPMLSPVMHHVDVYNYSFFIPARLTMERNKFEVFITGGKNGDGKDALGNTIQIPYCVFNRTEVTTDGPTSLSWSHLAGVEGGDDSTCLADFLGVNLDLNRVEYAPGTFKINMMPFIAFWKMWNEYFRDQNLHPDFVDLYPGIFESSGNITSALYAAMVSAPVETRLAFFRIPKVCWEKDYFTSALPFAQRGAPVETPLTGSATVTYKPTSELYTSAGANLPGGTLSGVAVAGPPAKTGIGSSGGGGAGRIENIDEIELSTGGFTINQLRLAVRLQEWLEKMARGGSRYIEQIKQQFGVTSSDARLQRPEFLGGGKIPVHISEVLQTSETGETALAEMAGHGVAAGNINRFNRFFEEHGFLISVMFVRPKTAYQQGLPRLFSQRFDKLDWAWPSFAHLGEQEIRNDELYFNTAPEDAETFGYQSRYAEFKYIPSTVHGAFKYLLNFWHWGRIFGTDEEFGDERPVLNKEFVECSPSNRIFNVVEEANARMYCIITNKVTAVRPLPYFGEPTL